jgi:hypothetical protein
MKRTICAGFVSLLLLTGASLAAGQPAALYTVTGDITAGPAVAIDQAAAQSIGETEIKTTVFVLGDQEHTVKGVLIRDLMRKLGSKSKVAKIAALDGYTMEIPTSDFMTYDVVLATEIDGKALSVRDKGPAWVIYPASQHPELKDTVYEARMVWQVKSVEFM